MKRIVEDTEASGLDALIGEKVILLCSNYFYTGELVGVNDSCVQLKDASIVYETGEWSASSYKDAQKLGIDPFFVRTDSIESFGKSK